MKIDATVNKNMALEKRAVLNIMYSYFSINENFNELLKPFEISGEQFNVLRILRGQKDKPANMCAIQERMIARSSNTTRLVDKLLLKELVTRSICEVNRRKMEVSITDKGLELLNNLDPLVEEHERFFGANLTHDEIIQLNELLEKYRTKQ